MLDLVITESAVKLCLSIDNGIGIYLRNRIQTICFAAEQPRNRSVLEFLARCISDAAILKKPLKRYRNPLLLRLRKPRPAETYATG